MIKILVYSVKRKELHAHRCKKYPRTCPSIGLRVMNSSFLLSYFFNLLLSFSLSFSSSFLFCFFFLFFLFFFVLYTMVFGFFTPFPPSTCGSGVGSPFSLLPLPLLKPYILSCKAACSLFRHHLHINATRELAGQHLMRG